MKFLNIKFTFIVLLNFIIASCSTDDDSVVVPEDDGADNNAPTIENQSFSIPQNASTGTSVGIISAWDEDNDDLTYTILSGNANNLFSIDSRGILFIDGQIDPSTDNYELTIQVEDNFSNASANVSIAVFDVTVTGVLPALPPTLNGALVGADYWSDELEILSAGLGFSDIVGLESATIDQNVTENAGGAWLSDISCNPDNTGFFTLTSTQNQVNATYILQTPYGELKDGAIGLDGLPVTFSWPLDTSTISLTDFRITLNTGEVVRPVAAGAWPNWENNERNLVVLFGEFSNRLPSDDPDTRFPVKCEIVADDTPLMFYGPDNQIQSGVGLTWETTSNPYDSNNGPRLVGAKLNHVGSAPIGEGSNSMQDQNIGFLPNDEFALYGGGDFRLRILTTGGFSPDGVRSVLPNEFERYFRIHATGVNGETVLIEQVGVDYQVQGGTLRVLGLSDLGRPESANGVVYGDCYVEDRDNYIDIILEGDEDAARNITFLDIPSLEGGYDPFYSPGGPGTTPFPGVRYTQPGPADLEPVIIALDDPMRITN